MLQGSFNVYDFRCISKAKKKEEKISGITRRQKQRWKETIFVNSSFFFY